MKDESPTETTLWAWNDALTSLLACFVICTVILITQINAKKTTEAVSDEQKSGEIAVFVFWPDGVDADVDTHLAGPDGDVVFFGHQSGRIWNLLRDDLGVPGDSGRRNYENGYARGLDPGDYTVNVHAFRLGPSVPHPLQVDIETRIYPPSGGSPVVYRQTVTLEHVKDEKTAIRFQIDQNGYLVPGSVHRNFKKLVKQK